MALLLFCLIIIALLHFYFQNVIVPALIITNAEDYLKMLEKLAELRKRNNISLKAYIAFSNIVRYTNLMAMDEPQFNDLLEKPLDHDIEENETYKEFKSLVKTSNSEIKDLILDYFVTTGRVLTIPSVAWIIYLFPALMYRNFKKRVTIQARRYSDNLTGNVILYFQYSHDIAV